MSEPTLAEQIWGLAKITKQDRVEVPVSVARRELLILKMIQEALNRGVTWAAIGRVLVGRPDGKAAKRVAKRLARDTQREMLRRGDVLN